MCIEQIACVIDVPADQILEQPDSRSNTILYSARFVDLLDLCKAYALAAPVYSNIAVWNGVDDDPADEYYYLYIRL